MVENIIDPMCPTSSEILQHIYYKRLAILQHAYNNLSTTWEINRTRDIILMDIDMCSTEKRRGTHIL